MRMEYLSEGEASAAWERMPDSAVFRPNAVSLSEYAATYFSEELDAIWQLAVSDGNLVLQRPAREDRPLTPIKRDTFSRHFGLWNEPVVASLVFGRDSAGRITQFTITTPRARM